MNGHTSLEIRSFNERLDQLFECVGIRRFDDDLLEKAGELLDSQDLVEPIPNNKAADASEYCKQKAEFLLDLADEDSGDEKIFWNHKAEMLLDLADDQPDKEPLILLACMYRQ